jgi:hypothetical protein
MKDRLHCSFGENHVIKPIFILKNLDSFCKSIELLFNGGLLECAD